MAIKHYTVYDIVTGDLLASGTAAECARRIGVHAETIRKNARGVIKSQLYEVVEDPTQEEKQKRDDMLIAAMKWDAFCEPIRKRYGIKVHGQEKED